jgi:hypothetical protein
VLSILGVSPFGEMCHSGRDPKKLFPLRSRTVRIQAKIHIVVGFKLAAGSQNSRQWGCRIESTVAQPNSILRNRLCFVLPRRKILISNLQPTQFYRPSDDVLLFDLDTAQQKQYCVVEVWTSLTGDRGLIPSPIRGSPR